MAEQTAVAEKESYGRSAETAALAPKAESLVGRLGMDEARPTTAAGIATASPSTAEGTRPTAHAAPASRRAAEQRPETSYAAEATARPTEAAAEAATLATPAVWSVTGLGAEPCQTPTTAVGG